MPCIFHLIWQSVIGTSCNWWGFRTAKVWHDASLKSGHVYILNNLKKDFKLQCMLKPSVSTVWAVYPIRGTISRHSWTLDWGFLQRRDSRWHHLSSGINSEITDPFHKSFLSILGFLYESEDRKQITSFLPWNIIPYSTVYSLLICEENIFSNKSGMEMNK